jgi:hypothetical protein
VQRRARVFAHVPMLIDFVARELAPIIHNSRSSINQNLRDKGICAMIRIRRMRIPDGWFPRTRLFGAIREIHFYEKR